MHVQKIKVPEIEFTNEFYLNWKVDNEDRVIEGQTIVEFEFFNGATIPYITEIDGIVEILIPNGSYSNNIDLVGLIELNIESLNPQVFEILRENRKYNHIEIDLSSLDLNKIPKALFEFTWLKKINLQNNNLDRFDYEWEVFEDLEYLNLKNNNFDLPNSIFDYEIKNLLYELRYYEPLKRIRNVKKNHGYSLDLKGLGLKRILPEVFSLNGIRVIDLSDNQIKEIPDRIKKLDSLVTLNLNNNELKYFSNFFLLLKKLENLFLDNNKIESLRIKYFFTTEKIFNTVQFIEAKKVLKKNDLDLLSAFLNKHLYHGWKSEDEIKSLLKEANLEKLFNNTIIFKAILDNTSIISDIKSVTSLNSVSNLNHVSLKFNKLTNIPFHIFKIPSLKKIELEGNNIENIPIPLLNKDLGSILNYLDQIDVESKENAPLYEAKLVLVGKGTVGKTSISQKIINPLSELKKHERSEGVEISPWEFKSEALNANFKFDIWDFAGQEKYDSTHQLFITDKSFYLVVLDARYETERTTYTKWLKTIKNLAPNSPILIVINKIDQHVPHNSFPIGQIKKDFPNVIDYIEISCSDIEKYRKTIYHLISKIQANIYKLPHLEDLLPKTWIRIRKKLLELKVEYITIDEYYKICINLGLNKKQAAYLSEFFHDLGVIIHFSKHDELKNIVILNYEWCVEGLYRILDSKDIRQGKGVFHKNYLNRIWQNKFKFRYQELIGIMLKFDLCFKIPNSNKFVVPRLLPNDIPEFEWNYLNDRVYELKFSFLPEGVIKRFIVRNHSLIYNNLYWSQGVVIKFANTEAYIHELLEQKKIKIRVAGEEKKQVLGIILQSISNIQQQIYPNISYQKLIQCNCYSCIKNEYPTMHKYKDLVDTIKYSKKRTVFCISSYFDINIKSLIYDSMENDQQNDINEIDIIRTIKKTYSKGELINYIKSNRMDDLFCILLDIAKEDGNKELALELISLHSDYSSNVMKERSAIITKQEFNIIHIKIIEKLKKVIKTIYP